MAINIETTLSIIDTEIATYWQDILGMQANYFAVNGKYAQGITTHNTLPKDGVGSALENLTGSPLDQLETWNDLVTLPSTLKAALTIDIYETVTTWGWVATFDVTLNGVQWSRSLDLGPLGRDRVWYAVDAESQETLEDIISCWTFDETSGARYDIIGTNHLTEYNTVGYTADGVINNAAIFDPDNLEYCGITTSLFTNNTDFTFCGWFYIDSSVYGNKTQKILQLLDGGSEKGNIEWYQYTNPPLKIKLFNKERSNFGPVDAPSDTWHFVEYYYNSAKGSLGGSFNNGDRLEISGVIFEESVINKLTLGALKTNNDPIIRLDQWYLFDRLITRTELNYLYNSGNGRELG